ncbi:uncharacterized protein At1g66480-like [Arachis duranensis]|uniref:Plastid movement impaired protein n=2 Tax=Arachis TaxID=3817 RepID=A0A445DQG5_ARAHY|nr:uncharacterized protein At1g66480-like [Arachis duranensis]XP_025690305.1 uncharacterized protein At1g66480 isoform X1 [Arachis hypogaea]RYR65425.1 hypothetical protein Ahy_A03g011359 [Arachis hypogaea]
MGNAMARSKRAKVMKIDGETFKLKTPAVANDVVKDYPGHVLLDSESVKQFGLRAKPLEAHYELKPNKVYFLVELPKPQQQVEKKPPLPRRARSSGIIRGMNAQERLDFLMLSKRSVSDLALVKNSPPAIGGPGPNNGGPMRVKMRIPRAQLDMLMEESGDGGEVAEKIMSLYIGNNAAAGGGGGEAAEAEGGVAGGNREVNYHHHKARGKRVSFRPVEQGEIRVEAAAPPSS